MSLNRVDRDGISLTPRWPEAWTATRPGCADPVAPLRPAAAETDPACRQGPGLLRRPPGSLQSGVVAESLRSGGLEVCKQDDAHDRCGRPNTRRVPEQGATTRKPRPMMEANGMTVARHASARRTRGRNKPQRTTAAMANRMMSSRIVEGSVAKTSVDCTLRRAGPLPSILRRTGVRRPGASGARRIFVNHRMTHDAPLSKRPAKVLYNQPNRAPPIKPSKNPQTRP